MSSDQRSRRHALSPPKSPEHYTQSTQRQPEKPDVIWSARMAPDGGPSVIYPQRPRMLITPFEPHDI